MKHILHICSDYSSQKLYQKLVSEIAKNDIRQTILVPVRSKKEIGKYNIENNDKVLIHYAFILKKHHRLFYFLKINMIYNYIVKNDLLKEVDFVHAHFLYSDGGVAYKIKKKFTIPYIVAIRNTDLNFFFKCFLHLKKFITNVLNESNEIILLTPSYQEVIIQKFGVLFKDKLKVIPNGLSSNWFDSINGEKKLNKPIKLLYVGDFSKNKNIIKIINYVNKINNDIECTLTLVGGGGEESEKIFSKITNNKNITYIGRIKEENQLINTYKEHDVFIMLSKLETFGVVYIEAISQGLPIIYTKGQGVDGYFKIDDFAYPCDLNSFGDFKNAIISIMQDYQNKSKSAQKDSSRFRWELIATEYLSIYNNNTFKLVK